MSSTHLIKQHFCFNGWQKRYRHYAETLDCEMQVSVFLPAQANSEPVPAVYWLSGLTCTDENFILKAGAQRIANELSIALICPDTSPRGVKITPPAGAKELGEGAGFYLNATQAPWQKHYQMYDYVTQELIHWAEQHLPITRIRSISGHSMGGHGAMIAALKNPELYQSVSAFAPICQITQHPLGQQALQHYLGNDPALWQTYDACALLGTTHGRLPIFIEQGLEDEFLPNLHLQALRAAAIKHDYPVMIREQARYDHSYFFVASFIRDHLNHHYHALKEAS